MSAAPIYDHRDVRHLVRTRRELLQNGWTDGRIRNALVTGRLHAPFAGTYTAVDPVNDPLVMLAAAQRHHGEHTVAVLDSAAMLHRLPAPWPPAPSAKVRVRPGHEVDAHPAVEFHAWKLDPSDVTTIAGLAVTTLRRTLVDLMCLTDRLSAVSALDAALRTTEFTTADLEALQTSTRRRRGAARSRSWWREADGRSESPLETRVRLRAIDGGHAPHDLQKRFVIGVATYYADLAWRQPNGRWLVAEADGATFHDTPDAVFKDRRRANSLVGEGDVDLVRFTWRDTLDAASVPATLGRLLGPPLP